MADKWDRSSKDDFNRAASGAPPKDKTVPPQHGLDQGPRPPGGHAPRQTAWDRHQAEKQAKAGPSKAGPDKTRDDPELSRNFNTRAKG